MEKGYALLNNPFLNKGTAFSEEERKKYRLIGLLPPQVESLKLQAKRAYLNVEAKASVQEKRHYLMFYPLIPYRNRLIHFLIIAEGKRPAELF